MEVKYHDKTKADILSAVMLITLGSLAVFLIMSSRNLFPYKYFFDNETIRNVMTGEITADSSYTNVARVYSALGFDGDASYVIEESVSAIIFIITSTLLFIRFPKFFRSVTGLSMFVVWIIFYAAYLSQMGKDQIAFLVVIFPAFVLLNNSSHSIEVFFVSTLLYAWFFRSYWFLIVGMTILSYFFVRKSTLNNRKKVKMLVFSIFFEVVVILVVYRGIYGDSLLNIRYNINLGRQGASAIQSMIPSLLSNNNIFSEIINVGYTLLVMTLPIHLTSISQISYYLWLYMIVFIVVRSMKRSVHQGQRTQYYLLFLISFFVIQSLFEPDLGSCLRHETILFPLVVQIMKANQIESEVGHNGSFNNSGNV